VPGDFFIVPASLAQQRLWLLHELDPGTPLYNVPLGLHLRGPVDAGALEHALGAVVTRHEALRTTFEVVDGAPVQVIATERPVRLARHDLGALPRERRDAEASLRTIAEARRPFDLEAGPLLRATLVGLGDDEHLFLLTLHHVVADGWSLGILLRELSELYRAAILGGPASLPAPPIQYPDYSEWQRQWLRGETLAALVAYWKGKLAGSPALLELPADRPRPAVPSGRGGRLPFTFSRPLHEAVERLGREERASAFSVLLAAFASLLHRYTGKEDIVIGSPVAGRERSETLDLIGCFINTLVLRTRLDGDPSFRALLRRVREVVLEAQAHQGLSFEKLVEVLQPERDLSLNPLFQVMFSFHGAALAPPDLPGVAARWLEIHTGLAQFDLTLTLVAGKSGLGGSIEYNADLYDGDRIRRLSDHLGALLAGAVEAPGRPLSDLPFLTAAERQTVLAEWSGTAEPFAGDCLHRLVAARAEQSPAAVAVLREDEHFTYGELWRRAERLAAWLARRGVGPEVIVGVCVERSLGFIVGMLGTLRAGGAYMPLDPTYPCERLRLLVADSGAGVILTQGDLAGDFAGLGVCVLCLEELADGPGAPPPSDPASPDNLAYVIYTSGSTGRPKGVAVSHGAAAEHLSIYGELCELTPLDRVFQFASFTFDGSLEQIVSTLGSGARLVLRGSNLVHPKDILERLVTTGITVADLPATVWQQVAFECDAHPELAAGSSLRLVTVGGDVMPPESVALWQRSLPRQVRLFNAYGPTEATVSTTAFEVPEGYCRGPRAGIPIGRPLPGKKVYLLDRRGQPAPVGVPDELAIGGPLLARGYLGQPAQTAESFVPDAFSGRPGARLYRTGDLARWDRAGSLEFLGRLDQQVKVRGFRIEPGEIEALLARGRGVREARVVVRDDGAGDKRLVAYVVPNGVPPGPGELRELLQLHLPAYMLPTAFVVIPSFPLTPNGKLDHRALPDPEPGGGAARDTFVAPRDVFESAVAEIWAEVLRTESIGVHDHFFDLGGHSLLAAMVVSRIRGRFRIDLTLRTLFERPTVEGLAGAVAQKVSEQGVAEELLGMVEELEHLSEYEVRALLAGRP
jgi:amino acid adenylation domain-containing protein